MRTLAMMTLMISMAGCVDGTIPMDTDAIERDDGRGGGRDTDTDDDTDRDTDADPSGAYPACYLRGVSQCEDDQQCITLNDGWGSAVDVCADPCGSTRDCEGAGSGTASATCIPYGRVGACVLTCDERTSCPDGMTCTPTDGGLRGAEAICAWPIERDG